jgi:hypothetical protein
MVAVSAAPDLERVMNPQAVLDQAIAFHQTGKLADAERLYLQLMAAEPREATSRHLLGVSAPSRAAPARPWN